MPRGRAKLSDKQERILVQAQLMGLTARDMQQIGNRLMALKKEAEDKAEIAETIAGFTWSQIKDETRKDQTGWCIDTPEGYRIDAFRGKRGRSGWDSYNWTFDFRVTKPGTRFQSRDLKDKTLYIPYDWKKSFMPGESKELYAIIRWAKDIKWELQR